MGGGLCFSIETVPSKSVIAYSYNYFYSCPSKGLKMIKVPLLGESMRQSPLLNELLSCTAEILCFFFL